MGGATPGQAPGPVTGERVLASVKFYEDPKGGSLEMLI